MNPNSANQRWSRWTIRATQTRVVPYQEFVSNVTRFARLKFGSVTRLRIKETPVEWIIDVLTEGAPITDPRYVDHMRGEWIRALIQGLGPQTIVTVKAWLVSGSRENGTPPDQMIILPTIPLEM